MTAIEKLYAKIKELGVDNTDDLPAKTKRKISDFEKLYNSKSAVHIRKGVRFPAVIEKLNDLAEDILEETEIFVLEQKEPEPPKPPDPPKPEPKKDFFDKLFGY